MKRDDVFPSKYLKACDLNGKAVTVTIKSAPYETLKNPEGKEQGKTVLYFVRGKKALPLNIVNWDSVRSAGGPGLQKGTGRWHRPAGLLWYCHQAEVVCDTRDALSLYYPYDARARNGDNERPRHVRHKLCQLTARGSYGSVAPSVFVASR